MNHKISKLIRATYTMNLIEAAVSDSRFTSINPQKEAGEYFDVQLTRMSNGRMVACCGKYALKIFEDVRDKTGYDFTRDTYANARKQMIGAITRYENKTGKDYTPSSDKQDAIVKYVGCTSWSQLCEDCDELLDEAERYLSDVASGVWQPTVRNMVLNPKNIDKGQELFIRFSNGSKLHLKALGGNEFDVVSAVNTGLTANDLISITDRVIVGNKLCADVEMTSNSRLNALWLSPSAVKSFKTKEVFVCLIA